MINRRILLSGMSILASVSIATGAAFAVFTDTAQSTGNTFSTGNADLQIAQDLDGVAGGSPGTFGNDIPAPAITESGIFPNFSKTYFFWLKNNSTSTINLGLAANFAAVVTSVNPSIADQLNATLNCGGGPVGPFTINAWAVAPISLANSLLPGAQIECSMVVSLPNVDNTFQGSGVTFNGVFTGTQTP